MSAQLTEREVQVLRGMSQGMSNGAIGRQLFLSEDTVKTHARRLFRKLGARDRAHAVSLGHTSGLLSAAEEQPPAEPQLAVEQPPRVPADRSPAPATSPAARPQPHIQLRYCPAHIELCARSFFPAAMNPDTARDRAREGLHRLLGTLLSGGGGRTP